MSSLQLFAPSGTPNFHAFWPPNFLWSRWRTRRFTARFTALWEAARAYDFWNSNWPKLNHIAVFFLEFEKLILNISIPDNKIPNFPYFESLILNLSYIFLELPKITGFLFISLNFPSPLPGPSPPPPPPESATHGPLLHPANGPKPVGGLIGILIMAYYYPHITG